MTTRNEHNLSSWVSPTNIAKVIWRRRSRRYWHYRRSRRMRIDTVCWVILDTFIPTVFLCVGVLYFSSLSVRTIMANCKQKLEFWIPTATQHFYYSAYPVLGCYSQFPLLDISCYLLLNYVILDLSNEREYLHFYSNIPLPDISIITRRFSAPNWGRYIEVIDCTDFDAIRSLQTTAYQYVHTRLRTLARTSGDFIVCPIPCRPTDN